MKLWWGRGAVFNLSLHKSDESLDELDDGLLAFVARL